MRDMINNMTIARGADQTLSGATPNNSRAFDLREYNSASFYVETATVTDAGTAAGFTLKLQHSDTLAAADFVDVPTEQLVPGLGGDTTVTVDDDGDDNIFAGGVGYNGIKRYVRGVFTGTTGTDAVVRVVAVLAKPHRAPAPTVGASLATT